MVLSESPWTANRQFLKKEVFDLTRFLSATSNPMTQDKNRFNTTFFPLVQQTTSGIGYDKVVFFALATNALNVIIMYNFV